MLGLTVKRLKGKLSKYTNVSGYGLTKLIPEFLFYIRWADYINKMQELGITVCKPEISDNKNRDMHVKGLYNFRDTRIRMLRAETVADLFAILDEIKEKWGT